MFNFVCIKIDLIITGLDIRTVDLVINYSIPMPPDYVHRVGRTGRANQPGLAIMFVIPTRDIPYLTNVETYIGEKLTEMKIDGIYK
jgi:superfamily II DNA/RNA helicase